MPSSFCSSNLICCRVSRCSPWDWSYPAALPDLWFCLKVIIQCPTRLRWSLASLFWRRYNFVFCKRLDCLLKADWIRNRKSFLFNLRIIIHSFFLEVERCFLGVQETRSPHKHFGPKSTLSLRFMLNQLVTKFCIDRISHTVNRADRLLKIYCWSWIYYSVSLSFWFLNWFDWILILLVRNWNFWQKKPLCSLL